MIDPADQSARTLPPPAATAWRRPPGVVYAAAVVTWVSATGTAVCSVILAVAVLLIAGPLFDAFDAGRGSPRRFVVGAAVVVVALSAVADVVAWFVLRGHRWARWVLAGLSLVAATWGAMAVSAVAPLAVTAAGLAVTVLLFLPGAGAWFRTSGPRGPG